jgi:hypothetical protein
MHTMRTSGTNNGNRGLRAWKMALTLILLAGLALWGCGVKGPPVPPQRPPLQPAEGLTGSLEGDTVILTWHHDPGAKGIDSYVVLRAQDDPATPECPGCPRIYQRVGTAHVDRATRELRFSETVPDGYVYTYKLRAVGTTGDQGPDSRTIVIDRCVNPVERP